jgi:V/A-type H+/Na+-transporting ATPase subunit I
MWVVLLLVGLPLLIIFLREPIYHLFTNKRPLIKEPGEYFLGSLVEVLDTCTGYLSNTVSFIRVAAFSLAHVALMGAILMLVEMLMKEDAVTKQKTFTIASVLVMLGGNALVIVLEGLVVSIQSVRLIYYEFFGKFYKGEGKTFTPMKIGIFGDEK